MRRVARWAGLALGIIILLAAALFVGINTDPGRRFVVSRINQLETASGLDIDIGRIEGSIYGRMVIHDLKLSDPKGVFLTAPRVELDWRPFAYLKNHIDVRTLTVPTATLTRLPAFNPSNDPNAPILPDIDIDIGRLKVARLAVAPAVTGQRHLLSLDGSAKIADGRAQLTANAGAIVAPGLAGGDRLALKLDAVPDADRFDVEAQLQAPAGGFVAGLAGLDKALAADVSGKGSWKRWQGRARATLGGQAFANLAVDGRDGSFHIVGPLQPGLMFAEGSVRRLVQPLVQTDTTLTLLPDRRADLKLRAQSQALALAAEGRIDLGRSEYGGVKVAARLLQPGAIAPNARGRDVRLALLLNGPFATPTAAYELQAAALGFDETVLQGFRAAGRARIDADRIVIPVAARAQRIGGLNPAVGGLLTNVTLNGNLALSGTTLLSDNLRIRSDRLNATALVVADFAKGSYRAGLQGRIDNYLVEGVGLLDLDSHLDVVSAANGFGLNGRIAFRTRRIDNESARSVLGGNAIGSAHLAMSPAGIFTISDVRLSAPQLRITSGGGTYAPGGRINLRATGVSSAYGPLAVIVTGTIEQPDIQLRVANLGFGIGLRDVQARVLATGRGYAVTASGQSQYGPFTAEIEILSGRGPSTIDVKKLTIAGLDFQGRVVQTAAGPYQGTLTVAGSGLNGTVRLAAAGRYQQAIVSARAEGARIPGETPILVQRGLIDANVILYPDAPQIVADAQLAGVRSGAAAIDKARVRINYRGGKGQAQLVASGRSGVPFRIAAAADLSPDLYRVALRGTVNGIDMRLARPAEVRRVAGGWQLAPTTLVMPQGNVRLAGTYADGLNLQARFRELDLSVLNAFSPSLGLGGKATGSLDFVQASSSAFPQADAKLLVKDFTRAGVTTLSAPVDIAFAGQLRQEGGAASAIIRRGGAIIGRAQARLQPVSAEAGSWTERLLAAPLAGGIRYNGPAEVIWSLTGIAGMQLSGPIALAADFGGRVQAPSFDGIVRANALTFEDETYGTRITNLALQGRFDRSHFELTQLSGRAGDGTVTGSGRVGLASAEGFPIDIKLHLDHARLARSDAIGATATGDIAITNGPKQPALIKGDLRLPSVRYQIIRQGGAEVAVLEGVRRKGEPLPRPGEQQDEDAGVPSIWNLDLRVRADNEVFVSGMGLESEWSTDLHVGGTSTTPVVTGSADVIRGTYSFAGNRFDLTDGEVSFTGNRPINPTIRLVASATLDDATISLNVSGTAFNPQIAFSSSPSLPQDEIMARLLFGGSVTELSALQLVQLGASLNSLRGSGGGLNPLGMLRSATGLSRLRILGADEATGRGTAIAAGFYVSNKIYIELITDARGFTATQLEIALSRTLSLLSQAGSVGSSSASIRYRKQY